MGVLPPGELGIHSARNRGVHRSRTDGVPGPAAEGMPTVHTIKKCSLELPKVYRSGNMHITPGVLSLFKYWLCLGISFFSGIQVVDMRYTGHVFHENSGRYPIGIPGNPDNRIDSSHSRGKPQRNMFRVHDRYTG
jgi:hypothetical protein